MSLSFITRNLLTALLLIALQRCGEPEGSSAEYLYITGVEVLSHDAGDVKVDNMLKTIELLMDRGEDLTQVELKLSLAEGVQMAYPATATATYDLTANPVIRLSKNGQTVEFRIIVLFQSVPISVSLADWEESKSFGALPGYLSVYRYKRDIQGKKVHAFIAVADITAGNGRFAILGEETGYRTPTQFYEQSDRPVVVLNGGYFWSGTSLGLMIRGGQIISHAQPVVYREYNAVQTAYYPTQGAFGSETDGTFTARWVYESSHTLYAYPAPAPNRAGEAPCPVPSATWPEGGMVWQPKEAIGAGPLLLTKGDYKNLWEHELFDAASGVGPTVNHPRSAIAYHPNGYLVFFVCEGRNKRPGVPGLTLENVAMLLLDLGCTEAINLDGGGSSCMLINGRETIIPSDSNGQRRVTNAVALY